MKEARVVHIMPVDGIGGVETAARSLPAGKYEHFTLLHLYLSSEANISGESPFILRGPRRGINSVRNYYFSIRSLKALRPDLCIASLWRSALVLIVIRIILPSARRILFLHLPKSVHVADAIATRMAMELADEIWVDSVATGDGRVPQRLQERTRVVSFLTDRVVEPVRDPRPNFIFWGRLHPQKNIERSLTIFGLIAARLPNAKFTIIGPDSTYGDQLKASACVRELGASVQFRGAMSRAEILSEASHHSVFLQASHMEGMALSVIEAMQLGLVPLVTPVGEIRAYCQNGENSVHIDDHGRAAEQIITILSNPEVYRTMAIRAQEVWLSKPLYRDDVTRACVEVLQRSRPADASRSHRPA